MEYAINVKICFLATFLKRTRALGFMVLKIHLRKDLSISGHQDLQYNCEGHMALALAQYEDIF